LIMPTLRLELSIRLSRLLTLGAVLALASTAAFGQDPAALKRAMMSIVQVNFTTEILASPQSVVEFGGKVLRNYQPTIVSLYSSSGIVIDKKGHLLTFVGYRWVDIHGRNPRIEVVDSLGQKHPGKLVGIDQNMMIAVILCPGNRLMETPFCERCEIQNGLTVVLPVSDGAKGSQLESAQVVSVNAGSGALDGAWAIKVRRPVSLIGAPLLNAQNQVIGLIADPPTRSATTNPRMDVVDVKILGVSQMRSSASKIIAAGGDIQTGWLGVNVKTDVDSSAGVVIDGVEAGSPAHKAGLLPNDVVTKWNGIEIRDLMKFVQIIEDTPLGAKAAITIRRQEKTMTLTAVIEARKPRESNERLVFELPEVMALPGARITTGDSQFQSLLGIEIVLLTPQLAESLRMPVQSGLLIANVNKQTAFDLAGVLAGDIILGVDDVQVGDPQAFYDHLKTRGWGSNLILRLVRKGVQLTKTVRLPLRKID
jgi:S1-C subfamily serine protease